MNEAVNEAVNIMLEYVRSHSHEGKLEDVLFFAYRYLVDAHQWRLRLNQEELDEAWWTVRELFNQYVPPAGRGS